MKMKMKMKYRSHRYDINKDMDIKKVFHYDDAYMY